MDRRQLKETQVTKFDFFFLFLINYFVFLRDSELRIMDRWLILDIKVSNFDLFY